MYNIYQSSRRKDIQYTVYAKPSITIDLFQTDYVATVKEKKIGPFAIRWIQIMGVELPDDKEYVQKELARLQNILKKNFGTVFVQLGIINEITSFENISHRSGEFNDDIKQQRLDTQKKLCKNYWLQIAFRENMPQSNIIYAVQKTDEELIAEMNSGCKERVKKWIKKWLQFREATAEEYELFYQKRCDLSWQKGFRPIGKKDYHDLIDYMQKNKCGSLFVATKDDDTKDDDIVAWSICVYDKDRITYLYGFADRKYSRIGWHHFLKFKIFSRAREHWIKICDMMGGAPTWFPDHPLAGVSKFKESLGWTKIEVFGSYDIILRPLLYQMMKMIYRLKK